MMQIDTQPDELTGDYEFGWCPARGLPEVACACDVIELPRNDTVRCPPPADCEAF